MAKKPRPTKGVPEPVFQRELFNYLKRKEANPGKNVDASFIYNGIKYTFERGNGPYHSGFQIKKSSDQAAKEMARTEQKKAIKLSDGEKMFMQTYYDVANERNVAEGRTGPNKLEVDHKISRADKGLHHPYNVGLMERAENSKKGADSNYGKYKYEPLLPPPALQNVLDDTFKPKLSLRTKAKLAAAASLVPGMLGTAADAAETAIRFDIARQSNNPVDYLQAGISAATTALGATNVGDVAGVPLEFLNSSIDQHREGLPQIRGRSGAARASK